MPLGQRVVLVGGGHNALIAAFYLAKGGFKPLVLERREMVGGGAVTEEFYPGFRASILAHTVGPLRADIQRDLQLDRFSCELLAPDPRPLFRKGRQEVPGIRRIARIHFRSSHAAHFHDAAGD